MQTTSARLQKLVPGPGGREYRAQALTHDDDVVRGVRDLDLELGERDEPHPAPRRPHDVENPEPGRNALEPVRGEPGRETRLLEEVLGVVPMRVEEARQPAAVGVDAQGRTRSPRYVERSRSSR